MVGKRRLKVAMAGVGGFGAARRERMRDTGLFDIVAAYDTNPDALAAAEREDGARPMAGYGEMLDFPGIEAVFIATGAGAHAGMVMAAAERGLHVYVEKPLCSTRNEVSDLIEVQQRTGVVISVGHKDLGKSGIAGAIKGFIDAGKLGKVVALEATTCHSGGFRIKKGDWRGNRAANPGGMLFQCGVHKVHELMYYCGPIDTVSCRMRYDVNPDTETADAAICTLIFRNGVIGTLNAYHVTPYRHYVNIYGTAMNLYKEERGGEGESLVSQMLAPRLDGSVEPWERVGIPRDPGSNEGLDSFYDCVVGGGTPYPSLFDGARAVDVIFACEESARSGEAVAVIGI